MGRRDSAQYVGLFGHYVNCDGCRRKIRDRFGATFALFVAVCCGAQIAVRRSVLLPLPRAHDGDNETWRNPKPRKRRKRSSGRRGISTLQWPLTPLFGHRPRPLSRLPPPSPSPLDPRPLGRGRRAPRPSWRPSRSPPRRGRRIG